MSRELKTPLPTALLLLRKVRRDYEAEVSFIL